jgi:hypothetical protein
MYAPRNSKNTAYGCVCPVNPSKILTMLLNQPGELVTREDLQQALWRADTHVDFERGVNAAVNRLREVLGDSADSPAFIETLPRRGYRFIAPVESPATKEIPILDPVIGASVTPGPDRAGAPPILGPGAWRWDASLFKNTKVKEQVNVQFRAEGTNVLITLTLTKSAQLFCSIPSASAKSLALATRALSNSV